MTDCCQKKVPGLVKLQAEFAKRCSKRAPQIDPDAEHDWYSLTLGWALAKNLTIEQAHAFSLHIRYHTNLG